MGPLSFGLATKRVYMSLKHLSTLCLMMTLATPAAALNVESLMDTMTSDIPKPTRTIADDETLCMAQAIYFEARGEPIEGRIAMMSVVMNRADNEKWEDSICEVLAEPGQFSFVKKGGRVPPVNEHGAWAEAWILANLIQETPNAYENLLYFHNTSVKPGWRQNKDREAQIGRHVFYSE